MLKLELEASLAKIIER